MASGTRKKIFKPGRLYMAVLGLLAGILIISTGALVVYLLDGIEWSGATLHVGDLFLGLVIMLVVAILEELLFRAFILRRLMRLVNRWIALLASSVLFAIIHFSNTDITTLGLINIFLGGLLFGILFLYTRSIVFVIAMHFAWNFLQGPILGFPVSGLPFESLLTLERSKSTIINGGSFGFEGSVVCTVMLLLAFVVSCYWYWIRQKNIATL